MRSQPNPKGERDARKMERTSTPGIYKRGRRYVVRYKAGGRNRAETTRTLKQARQIKRNREEARDRGELQLADEGRRPFGQYAEEWIERYQGSGRHGFTDDTRADYKRDLERYAYPFLNDRLSRTVAGITPRDVAEWIAWLTDEREQGRRLADATVRRILSPVRACLATARREGAIRSNPVDGAVLPHRPEVTDDDDEGVKVLSREQLDAFLRVVRSDHRLMFELLATTGLRWGELAALQWRDVRLSGSEPCVRVRRALARIRRKDQAVRYKPPKSRHGKREVPLPAELVSKLREWRGDSRYAGDDDLVFPSRNGEPMRQENIRRRVLAPAASEAGAEWAGFHTFRHTFASLHIERGTTIVQVSRLLGHHSPAFTLERYAHLIPGDQAAPLDLEAERKWSDNGTEFPRPEPTAAPAETAV